MEKVLLELFPVLPQELEKIVLLLHLRFFLDLRMRFFMFAFLLMPSEIEEFIGPERTTILASILALLGSFCMAWMHI